MKVCRYIQSIKRVPVRAIAAAATTMKSMCLSDAAALFFGWLVADAVDAPAGLLVVVDAVLVATALTATGVFVAGKRVVVLPLMTTAVAPGIKEMTVPDTVMIPPGVSVWPLITYVVPELAV